MRNFTWWACLMALCGCDHKPKLEGGEIGGSADSDTAPDAGGVDDSSAPGADSDAASDTDAEADTGAGVDVDADGDGYGESVDCDDDDPSISPGAEEICDGIDNDCDGDIDPGYGDFDDDGAADCVDACPVFAEWGAAPGGGAYDQPFSSIAEAIERRPADCFDIFLFPGTFSERVDYQGFDLHVASIDGPEVTIIEPSDGGSVVTVANGESDDASLRGVTLRGGTGTLGAEDALGNLEPALYYGGGLFIYQADPTIQGCVLEDNAVDGYGGAGLLYDYDGTFSDNLMRDNIAYKEADQGGGGGALRITDSDATLIGNSFLHNQSIGESADGGAIEIYGGASLMTSNRFEGNVAAETGGGVRSLYSATRVLNNLFVDNQPDGLHLSYDDSGPVANNTFSGNSPYGITTRTCCGYSGPGPTSEIVNNLIVDSGEYAFAVTGALALSRFAHNDVYGAGVALFWGMDDPTGSDGNLSVDPLFVSADDLRLRDGSPAVDAGDDTSSLGVDGDCQGAARPLGSGYDLGAYESY